MAATYADLLEDQYHLKLTIKWIEYAIDTEKTIPVSKSISRMRFASLCANKHRLSMIEFAIRKYNRSYERQLEMCYTVDALIAMNCPFIVKHNLIYV